MSEEFCGAYKGDHTFEDGSNQCRCGRAFRRAPRPKLPQEEIDRLEAVLEPEGWEPPPSLTAEQILQLAANPELRGSDVLDEAYFDRAADEILAKAGPRKARLASKARGPKPRKAPQPPKPPSTKKAIRYAVFAAFTELALDHRDGTVNRVTNVVWRAVRPVLARVWQEGWEAGSDDLATCCGCSTPQQQTSNPYGEAS